MAMLVTGIPHVSLGETDQAFPTSKQPASLGQLGSIEFPASGAAEA
jgi:hypothetical protein